MTSSDTSLKHHTSANADFHVLAGDALRFSDLTYPSLAHRLDEVSKGSTPIWFAVGAEQGGEPVGLAMGVLREERATLLSIQVAVAQRRAGIGRRLLAIWEQEARRRGSHTLEMQFSDSHPQRKALERLMHGMDWSAPSVFFFQLVGRAADMARKVGEWKGVRGRVFHNAAIRYEPFILTPEDDSEVDRLLNQPEAKPFADPRKYASTAIPEISRTVRRHGRLVGWIIADLGRPSIAASLNLPGCTLVHYKEFYLDAALWRSFAGMGVFHHAFTMQADLFGESSLAIYTTHGSVPRMVALSQRRLAPVAIRFDTVFTCEKQLASS